MAYKSGSRDRLYNPKNGTQRVVIDPNHLQIFMNRNWMHDYRCKDQTNKECRKKQIYSFKDYSAIIHSIMCNRLAQSKWYGPPPLPSCFLTYLLPIFINSLQWQHLHQQPQLQYLGLLSIWLSIIQLWNSFVLMPSFMPISVQNQHNYHC